MPHHPWYREFDDWWYVQFGRKQKKLVKGRENEDAAKEAFLRLKEEDYRIPAYLDRLTVLQICKAFMVYSHENHTPDTIDRSERFLRQFCHAFGRCKAAAVKPANVEAWLNAKKSVPVGRSKNGEPRKRRQLRWASSTKNSVVCLLRSVFNWAVGEELLLKNPLKKLRKPPMGRRERILTPDERRAILSSIKDRPFKMYWYALSNTGARPGEVARVTAADVDLGRHRWKLTKHKTAKRTGKPRIIVMVPSVEKLCARLMREHPEGPLFLNSRGKPFTRQAIRCRFRRIREKLGLGPGVVAYTLRHTYVTEALVNGVPPLQVDAGLFS